MAFFSAFQNFVSHPGTSGGGGLFQVDWALAGAAKAALTTRVSAVAS